MAYALVQNKAGQHVKPTHTIYVTGLGNIHKGNLEEALEEFNKRVAELHQAYQAGKATRNYAEEITENRGRIVREVKLTNIKKNGQKGKFCDLVRLSILV